MDDERWQRIEALYHNALSLKPEERRQFLDQACRGDESLRKEVESLISSHESTADFMASPAFSLGIKVLANSQNETIPLEPGTRLGPYEILSGLGSGGMGIVYRAKDTRLERRVAVKLLTAAFSNEPDALRRFEQEARAASGVSHPNIAHIYEIGEAEGHRYIAMEYVEGDSLRVLLSRGPLSVGEAIKIAYQVAEALGAAHATGIVHRDIKPENILVRRDGLVKVVDFGLAKLTKPQLSSLTNSPLETQSDAQATHTLGTEPGLLMGTINYMSPEQARGIEIDARTDIWSLGVVLYEMLTGHRPFDGETPADVMASILKTDVPPLTDTVGELPSAIHLIVEKMLQRKKEERYQTIEELLHDLKAAKQELEFETELSRSVRPNANQAEATGESRVDVSTGRSSKVQSTASEQAPPDLSAVYLLTKIKQHRFATLFAIALIALAAFSFIFYLHPRNTETSIESIAVLPFDDQNDPNAEYLSDGLTEGIIDSLTRLSNLRVIARSSVFRFKGKVTDPVRIGRELGVRAVLVGRIFQHGDTLLVSAELVDVLDGRRLWGSEYEHKVSELLIVQPEIVADISLNLRLKVSGEEQNRIAKRYTDNPQAYQFYLKGRYFWNKRTGDDLKKSIDYFNQAIEIDAHYALAYAGLADAYILAAGYGGAFPKDSFPKARDTALRALEIDEGLAEAHTSLAYVYINEWNLKESNREFQRAIELNPNYPTAHHWYGNQNLLAMGRFEEAIGEIKRALEIDPLSLIINADLGTDYIFARQYDKAIEQLRKTIEMDQSFYYAHVFLGKAYELKGTFQDAIAEYHRAEQLNDDPRALTYLGHAFAAAGRRDEALKTLNQMKEMSKHRYVSPYYFAIVYAGLSESDQAFQWLETCYKERESRLVFLKIEPYFDNLRSDPRFTDLTERVGI